jgi:iron transport multicopper oxidase
MHVDNTDGSLPIPDSFLFNETNKPTQFHFEPRKRYMLRIVNMSALTCSVFHIKNHTLTVVGVDGQHTHPKVAQTISLCAGQRYDVIVVGNSSPSGVQYIAEMTTEMLTSPPPPNATYSVVGGMTFRNDTQSASNTPPGILDDFTLKPLDHLPLLANVTKRINWRTNQTYYEGLGTRISIGAQPFFKPKVPTLLTALSTGDHAWNASTYGVGQAPEIVRFNDVVEIYMENPQPFPHPMHLHVGDPRQTCQLPKAHNNRDMMSNLQDEDLESGMVMNLF